MTGKSNCLVCGREFKWRRVKNVFPKYCSRKCMNTQVATWNQKNRFRWQESTFEQQIDHLSKIFNKHVIKTENCWDWNGVLHKTGYALMNYNKDYKSTGAHRISWLIHHKEFPQKFVLHTCDNKKCTNPKHLFLGSATDNAIDREKKNRGNPRKGENHPYAKLNVEKVIQIRKLLELGVTITRISKDFKISKGAIDAIKRKLSWKHIP